MPERVAAGHEQVFAAATLLSDQPVREDAFAVPGEEDIARTGGFRRARFDAEHVAGPDRGNHARTERPDAEAAVTRQHVPHQARHRGRQEFFLTALHWAMLLLILPHASAMVSNSCSRLNAGF
jgi:hypothetical protein